MIEFSIWNIPLIFGHVWCNVRRWLLTAMDGLLDNCRLGTDIEMLLSLTHSTNADWMSDNKQCNHVIYDNHVSLESFGAFLSPFSVFLSLFIGHFVVFMLNVFVVFLFFFFVSFFIYMVFMYLFLWLLCTLQTETQPFYDCFLFPCHRFVSWWLGICGSECRVGHWFTWSSDGHVKVPLGKILNPKLLLLCVPRT